MPTHTLSPNKIQIASLDAADNPFRVLPLEVIGGERETNVEVCICVCMHALHACMYMDCVVGVLGLEEALCMYMVWFC